MHLQTCIYISLLIFFQTKMGASHIYIIYIETLKTTLKPDLNSGNFVKTVNLVDPSTSQIYWKNFKLQNFKFFPRVATGLRRYKIFLIKSKKPKAKSSHDIWKTNEALILLKAFHNYLENCIHHTYT